ncbi:MAG: pentapeptide repeat-containing protein [Marinospirillum sp.]|uniref:pentapeptide repeat-containing protein n=1 Tax=Marinospirillum sp. TaxID=2183934 RepID=UPI0019E20B0E|nr:hypothetical protein [Marinospirillum sp.]MBE0508806.1 pentapeptide repeat-containing protein [Marinospirillum sp.]
MLTTPKPLNPNEWLADTSDCKGFYRALQEHLIESVSRPLGAPSSKVAYLFQKHPSGQFDDEVYELADQLRSTVLEVHGVHFPASEKESKWDYLQLFTLIPKLHFVNCHFYCSEFSNEFLQPHFTGCTFHHKFQVAEWDAPDQGFALFESCCFKQKASIKGNELGRLPVMGYSSVFKDCELAQVSVKNTEVDTRLFWFSIEIPAKLQKLKIKNCTIKKKLSLANIKGIQSLELISTVFNKKFALINCSCAAVDINNTNFNGLADFYESRFEKLRIQKSIFRDFAGFEDCHFGVEQAEPSKIFLNYVTFYSFINFRSAVFNQPLDLRNTNRQQQPNFLDARFKAQALQGTDRETFRIIKHSFDAVGNHIEANKYFARELQAYRRELHQQAAKGETNNLRERLLLWLNAQISNHGQNYLKPAIWLGVTISLAALVFANDRNPWFTAHPLMQNWWDPTVDFMNGLALGFLPIHALVGQSKHHLAFVLLVTLVLISTFTWHLLVAIRRHSKR